MKKFPLLKEMVVHDVTIRSGECLFIPAWWWMQSKTVGAKADKAMREGKVQSHGNQQGDDHTSSGESTMDIEI